MKFREWKIDNKDRANKISREFIDTRYTLDELTTGSGRYVKFMCEDCGNTWETEFRTRIRDKSNCPFCSGNAVKSGFNDLQTWCNNNGIIGDKILKDFIGMDTNGNIIDASKIYKTSHLIVKWKCHICGYEWESSLYSRVTNEIWCNHCSNNALIEGVNDLRTWALTNPGVGDRLLDEWCTELNAKEGIYINKVTRGSRKKAFFKCSKCNTIRQQIIYDYTRGIGCSNCSSKGTSYPEQFIYSCIQQVYSDAENRCKVLKSSDNKNGIEFDIGIPSIKTCIEYSPTYWHKHRSARDELKAKTCENAGVRLIQIIEDSYDELEHTISENKIVFKMDENNKDDELKFVVMVLFRLLGLNCSTINIDFELARREAFSKSNCLSGDSVADNAELLSEWDFDNNLLDPSKISINSHLKVHWVCGNCGHNLEESPNIRIQHKSGCTFCGYNVFNKDINIASIKQAIAGETDLATLYPQLMKEWDIANKIDPNKILPGSNKKVLWKCSKCNHSWITSIAHRTKQMSGCPNCGNNLLK